MNDYELFYWSVPFRGQFVRAVLAYAGKSWTEGGDAAICKLISGSVEDMPVPFMGPPILIDKRADIAIAQMPAIVFYLGETLGLMPDTPGLRAMTLKIVNDANDVLDELTLDGGREMWTQKSWRAFTPRLKTWMSFWEETGRRYHLEAHAGFLLRGRGARRRRHRDRHPLVDHGRSLPGDRKPPRRGRTRDRGPDAEDRQPAAPGRAGRPGAARLWRRLLRRLDRGVVAAAAAGVERVANSENRFSHGTRSKFLKIDRKAAWYAGLRFGRPFRGRPPEGAENNPTVVFTCRIRCQKSFTLGEHRLKDG
jgi:hypothetical protein